MSPASLHLLLLLRWLHNSDRLCPQNLPCSSTVEEREISFQVTPRQVQDFTLIGPAWVTCSSFNQSFGQKDRAMSIYAYIKRWDPWTENGERDEASPQIRYYYRKEAENSLSKGTGDPLTRSYLGFPLQLHKFGSTSTDNTRNHTHPLNILHWHLYFTL